MNIRHASIMGALLLMLGGCAQQAQPQVDMARIAMVARTALTGLESAAAAYVAGGTVTQASKDKIVAAEASAEALVAALPTATPADAATTLNAAIAAINAVMAVLPTGTVPAQVQAGVIAFEIAATTAVAIMAPAPAPAPVPVKTALNGVRQ